MSRDSVRRAFRTFLVATLALFLPGLLGWLNALTEWARSEGSTPFPDAHGLAYLGVSAIVGGVIGLVNLLVTTVEDASGKALMRDVPPRADRGQEGGVSVPVAVGIAVAVIPVIIMVVLLL